MKKNKLSDIFIKIIVFFLSFLFSIAVTAKTFLVCDNITDKDVISGKLYLYLDKDKLTLYKIWTDHSQSNNKNKGFKKLKEEDRLVDNIISETEDHIIFQNNKELDKIQGIFTTGNNDNENILSYHCRSFNKKDWVVKN